MTTTWFVTGASSGIGAAIVEAALAKGDKVIAASRDAAKLSSFKEKGAITVSFNVNGSSKAVADSVEEIIKSNGPVDIVVNNAGFGQLGSLEEAGADLLQEQFNTNVFGPVKVITAFLPHFRSKKSGLFITIGSRCAYEYIPLYSLYCSSKAAIQIISATLDKEVKEFGIRSVLVEAGAFKTGFMDGFLSGLKTNDDTKMFPAKVADYEKDRRALKDVFLSYYDKQPGDPAELGQHLVRLAHQEAPFDKEVPEIITFGKDAVDIVESSAKYHSERINKWKEVSYTTDKFS